MSSTIVQSQAERKAFEPGTTGWTARDLDDREIARQWDQGKFEIIEGVLTIMPPAYFLGGEVLANLTFLISQHLREGGIPFSQAPEPELMLAQERILRPDYVFVLAADAPRGTDWKKRRLEFPPTLVIESLSLGHERHDEELKREWYAEFGVQNYWLLNGFQRTLECLVLEAGAYRTDQRGKDADQLRASLFPGFVVPLEKIWV